MGKKIVVVLTLVVMTGTLFAEFNRSSVLIDVPTAYVLRDKVFQGTAVGSFALSSSDTIQYDFDISLGLGLKNCIEFSLTAYELENYSLGITAMVLREKDWYPSVAIGIHDITWMPYIGSYGGSDSLPPGNHNAEDRYINKPGFSYWESPEWFSAFAVASKQFGDYFRMHIGVGRGRYVGYQDFLNYFNTDIFNPTSVSPMAFGLFGALEFNYQGWLSVAAEFDGRDLNLGTKIGFQNWEVYLAVTRLENLLVPSQFSPRLVTGLNLYTSPRPPNGSASVFGKVTYPDGRPAAGTTVEVFVGNETQSTVTDDQGDYRIGDLPAGMGTVVASIDGHRSRGQTVKLTTGVAERLNLPLHDIHDKGTIRGTVRDADDGSGIIATVYVVETGDAVRAGPRDGTYEIVGLDPGKYTLRSEARGYFDHQLTCPTQSAATTILDVDMRKNWIIFHFKPGEGMIEPRYIPVLEDVVRFLSSRPTMIVEIQGHTDSVGDARENRELSRRRAEAVRDYLVNRGISQERLVVKGYGELAAIGDNRTVLGRDMNRRVELRILSE